MQTPQAGRLWQESAPGQTNCGILAGIVFPNPVLHQISSDDLLVSDRTGRFVAVNVLTFGNVRALTVGSHGSDGWVYGSAQIGLVNPCYLWLRAH